LTFQVKRSGGGSHKALGLHQYWLGSSASNAGFNSRPLDAISLTNHDNLFTF